MVIHDITLLNLNKPLYFYTIKFSENELTVAFFNNKFLVVKHFKLYSSFSIDPTIMVLIIPPYSLLLQSC